MGWPKTLICTKCSIVYELKLLHVVFLTSENQYNKIWQSLDSTSTEKQKVSAQNH